MTEPNFKNLTAGIDTSLLPAKKILQRKIKL